MSAGDVFGLVLAIAALAVSAVSLVSSRRAAISAERAARRSEREADRAESFRQAAGRAQHHGSCEYPEGPCQCGVRP